MEENLYMSTVETGIIRIEEMFKKITELSEAQLDGVKRISESEDPQHEAENQMNASDGNGALTYLVQRLREIRKAILQDVNIEGDPLLMSDTNAVRQMIAGAQREYSHKIAK